ncbi:MAG: Rieske (2Fe-2S) protein [Betaproteobacteria bacterium]|nr:Rieske 2Fe-2S domain-containing protein [Pseudomonadota bacterium]NBO11548.1 Rieske (2Fe-2S) protein [Betaproteobacteria bacterium]NBO43341.1 Rieske (2Fe-2S) protein [Betaproteobacteria bacterium]NBP09755.1 Rieske (2Fe-2S) protein [Betaproteobacteria bacterium]NBP61148.1 Rieske (2Fe-2S) protein [Betaproteobacteria bacterium]
MNASASATWKTVWTDAGCASELVDGGAGLRTLIPGPGGEVCAFVVRYEGQNFAYLNRCAHVPVELDWLEGAFFDDTGHFLVCATHGAMYEPKTGLCVDGPCRGRSLEALDCRIDNGRVQVRRQQRSAHA